MNQNIKDLLLSNNGIVYLIVFLLMPTFLGAYIVYGSFYESADTDIAETLFGKLKR